MVIASAGRRVDAQDAKVARFPPERLAQVAEEIQTALQRLEATVLVSSAACGADILALEAARQLGIRRRVVLPFDRDQFRETSVVDRPGAWGSLYDSLLDEIERQGDEVVLGLDADDDAVWTTTNNHILEEAKAIARNLGSSLGVLVVWDGESRGPDDVTAHFLRKAQDANLLVTEIYTS
jgi:hypothetical protein